MNELLNKFYAGETTPEEEARLLAAADSLPEGPDRELLQGLAAMRRQAAIGQMIDNVAAETGQAPSLQRPRWPYWIGALAMAACILLMLLPREAMPVQVAENDQPAVWERPQASPRVETRPASSHRPDGSVVAETGQAPSLPEEVVAAETGQAPSLLEEEIFYAEAEPLALPEPEADDDIIIISAPSLIAHANSSTLIAQATPAEAPEAHNSQLSTLNFHLVYCGQTLGDPEADPFGRRPIFGN